MSSEQIALRRQVSCHRSPPHLPGPVEQPEAEAAVAAREVPRLREIDARAVDAGLAVGHGVTRLNSTTQTQGLAFQLPAPLMDSQSSA